MGEHPPPVLGIDHVVLRVASLERSIAFYRDVLGCPIERTLEALGLVQLRAGSCLIDLVPIDGELGRAAGGPPDPTARNVDHFALRVDASPRELAVHLARCGIACGDFASRYGGEGFARSVYLEDPDGNVVELRTPPGSDA